MFKAIREVDVGGAVLRRILRFNVGMEYSNSFAATLYHPAKWKSFFTF